MPASRGGPGRGTPSTPCANCAPLPPAPLRLSELRAAPQLTGERGRTVSAVDLTLLDVATEFFSALYTGSGPVVRGGGLRGGRWELDLRGGRELLRLHALEYVPGLRLTGSIGRFLSRRPEGRVAPVQAACSEGLRPSDVPKEISPESWPPSSITILP